MTPKSVTHTLLTFFRVGPLPLRPAALCRGEPSGQGVFELAGEGVGAEGAAGAGVLAEGVGGGFGDGIGEMGGPVADKLPCRGKSDAENRVAQNSHSRRERRNCAVLLLC